MVQVESLRVGVRRFLDEAETDLVLAALAALAAQALRRVGLGAHVLEVLEDVARLYLLAPLVRVRVRVRLRVRVRVGVRVRVRVSVRVRVRVRGGRVRVTGRPAPRGDP